MKINDQGHHENPFALSIGDLMAALLLIFVLLLSATLLRLQNEYENKSMVAERYSEIKKKLYEALKDEFKEDLPRWNAEIDENSLTLRFNGNTIKEFDGPKFFWRKPGDYELNEDHKKILSDFFPRYIRVIYDEKFRNNVVEVRIEGHTDTQWYGVGSPYIKNMELSQNRTRSVLEYSLNTISKHDEREWAQEKITANGLSYSKLLLPGQPTNERNRRVEFRIVTDAEVQLEKMLELGSGH